MNTTRITYLVDILTRAADAYYNGNPIMSDAQYDALENELRTLDPTNAFFSRVGAPVGASSGWVKARHAIPMASLNKAQEAPEMAAWVASCGTAAKGMLPLIIMDKLDGASINLRFDNGKFTQGITRGDGLVGEDITRNVKLMKFPKVIPGGFNGFARGEVVVTHTDFKANFAGSSNPRNTANGTMKRQSDADPCQYLTVIVYDLIPDSGPLASKAEELTTLAGWGFQVPRWQTAMNLAEVQQCYDGYVASVRASLNYDIDGLVVCIDKTADREALGMLNNRPKGAVAYKFPHEEKETILRDVVWQVGNSGRLTPVAFFDAVSLVGASIKQASLHNLSNMARLADEAKVNGITVGDTILVCRRNDVIPYVEAIVKPDVMGNGKMCGAPSVCPACGTAVQRDGEYLVCRGDNCPAQIKGAILNWVSKVGILHFGESLIEALIDAGMVEDAADLYTVDPVAASKLDMGGRRVGGTADRGFKNLHDKKDLDLHVFVGSLGIPLWGRSMTKTLVDAGFDTLDKMLRADVPDIAAVAGIGPTKAASFVKGLWDRLPLVSKLLGVGVTIKKKVMGTMTGKSMCLTGFRDQALQDAFEAAGGTVKSGVSRGLDYLVALDPSGTSGKLDKARQLGTQVIGADDLRKMLGI